MAGAGLGLHARPRPSHVEWFRYYEVTLQVSAFQVEPCCVGFLIAPLTLFEFKRYAGTREQRDREDLVRQDDLGVVEQLVACRRIGA